MHPDAGTAQETANASSPMAAQEAAAADESSAGGWSKRSRFSAQLRLRADILPVTERQRSCDCW